MEVTRPNEVEKIPLRSSLRFDLISGTVDDFQRALEEQEDLTPTEDPNRWAWGGYQVQKTIFPNGQGVDYIISSSNGQSMRSYHFHAVDRLDWFIATTTTDGISYRTYIKVGQMPLSVRRTVTLSQENRNTGSPPIFENREDYVKRGDNNWQKDGIDFPGSVSSFVMNVNGAFPHDALAYDRPTHMKQYGKEFIA